MSNRLNFFQRTMLRWRDLHPYNAVHVVTVADRLDGGRLRDAIARQLDALGMAHLELDRARGRYEWLEGTEETDLRLFFGDDPARQVDDEIVKQLNAAFPHDGQVRPFRFFAVDAGSSFHLGLAYDHFVAGGDSIVRLLCGILGCYHGEPAAPTPAGVLSAPSYGRLFLRNAGAALRGLASLPGIAAACRRSFRPVYTAIDDGRNAFARLRLGPPEHATLVRVAKAWGVTQNDLFMTLLLKALSPLALRRRRESARRELGVASIANIRRDFGPEGERAFAPLLASFRVSHLAPDEMGMKELACSVHAETNRIRQRKLYLQTLLGLGVAGLQWRFFSDAQRRSFFAKHYAVWAGTTPLNVGSLWSHAGGHKPAPEYLRAVSTGPLTPMVCAISTGEEVINVGISYRTTAFDRNMIEGVIEDMLLRIRSL